MNCVTETIINRVALRYNIQPSALRISTHNKHAVAARRVVAICLRRKGYSYPEIGEILGCVHTTAARLVGASNQPRGLDAKDNLDDKIAKAEAEATIILADMDSGTLGRAGLNWRAGVTGHEPPEPRDTDRMRFDKAVAEYRDAHEDAREAVWATYCRAAFPNSWERQAAQPPRVA